MESENQVTEHTLKVPTWRKIYFWLIIVFNVVIIVGTIAGYFSKYARILDILSSFKIQLLIASSLVSGLSILLYKHKTLWIVLMAMTALLNVSEILPWYFGDGQSVSNGKRLRVCMFNIKTGNKRHADVVDFIKTNDPDILVLQEVNDRWLEQLSVLKDKMPYWERTKVLRWSGVQIISKYELFDVEEFAHHTNVRPNIKVKFRWDNQIVTLISGHPTAPKRKPKRWEARNKHLEFLSDTAAQIEGPVLLVGDLNTTMWSHYYKYIEERGRLTNARKGFGTLSTWPAPLAEYSGVPIDHIMHSDDFEVINCELGNYLGSDHLPIWADLFLKEKNLK